MVACPTPRSHREQLEFRLRTLRAGVRSTVAMLGGVVVYALLTWDSPHRTVLLLASVGGALLAVVAGRIVLQRPGGLNGHALLLCGWNLVQVGLVSCEACLDGGPQSPLVAILFVSVAFAAVSLPRRAVAWIAALDVLTLLAISAVTANWPSTLVPWIVALIVVATIGDGIAADRRRRSLALQGAEDELCRRLARVVEYRDDDTGLHMARMSEYAATISRQLGWPPAACTELKAAATMHDIGKVAIPDRILLKPGPLTDDERDTMQKHTLVGHHMLAGSSDPVIQMAADIALSHHERWDGQGYPHGISGEDIPLIGRIIAVADVFDALTSDRVYRSALPVHEALEVLTSERGRHFDPAVLDAFLGGFDEIVAAGRLNTATAPGVPARSGGHGPSPLDGLYDADFRREPAASEGGFAGTPDRLRAALPS